MSTNYTQYLGAKRCCDLKVQGPQGPQGVTGPVSIGPMGYQGVTGSQGYQGATGRGCAGPTGAQGPQGPAGGAQGATGAQGLQGETGAQGAAGTTGAQGFQGNTGAQGFQGATGPVGITGAQGATGITGAQGLQGETGAQGFQGATGASQWTPMNGLGITGGGYTGIGVTGQDVLIYGNLLVTGGIDPTYLALTPQASGPQGFINPLWVDSVNGNALRSEKLLINTGVTGQNATMGTVNLTINNSLGTGTSASLLTLNQTTTAGILYTEKYNQRNTTSGTSIQESYYAKSGSTKTEFARVRLDTPTSTSGQYVISVNQAGVLTNYLTCNGSGGSLEMNAPFLDMASHPILAVTTITDIQSLPFLPQGDITASSNNPTLITAYNNNHQVLLRASPVPVIDRLDQQSQFVSGAVRCSCEGSPVSFGATQWLGTPNGDVYMYDGANWTLVASFTGTAGTINALFYNSPNDRLYIGGSFTDCTYPSAVPNLNNVCYIQTPSTTPTIPTQMVWAGGTNAGFNAQCNAIAGDGTGDYVYFGGNFNYTTGNVIQLQYFGCYQESTNTIVPINNQLGDGFDNQVYNLNYIAGSQVMCATGDFTTLVSGGGSFISQYCITFTISNNVVSAINILDGATTSLSSSIQGYDLIDNNGSNFFVGLGNQSYYNGANTINYLMNLSASAISGTDGANLYSDAIGSFFFNSSAGYVEAVTAGSYTFFQNGSPYAVIPFQPFLFRFFSSGLAYFNKQVDGTQWAFTGSYTNQFTLSPGRTIIYGGVTFSGGVNTSANPLLGSNLLLNWNTAYYIVVGTPQSVGAWSFF